MTNRSLRTIAGGALGRRSFLRAVGAGALGLAGAALIGCTDGDDENGTNGTGGATSTPKVGGTQSPDVGTVSVLGIWGDEELESFEAVLEPWSDETDGEVDFTSSRDITALLTTRVEGNNPPDIAIPAEVGLMQQFAADNRLVSLEDLGVAAMVRDRYPEGFADLATVNNTLYGFFMKADTKATIWYSPRVFQERGWQPLTANSTWDDLIALSQRIRDAGMAPWSMGVESEGASGWPGTDWIQQIVLNVHGEEFYDQVVSGTAQFTDPRMKDAWERFGRIALTEGWVTQGGGEAINATGFQESAYPPFEDEPEAAMVYLGGFASGFIADQFSDLTPGEDYDFMPFPGGKVTGGANVVYAFNDDAGTRSLMEYLAGAEAQQVWVERGGFTSVNQDVGLDLYPDPVARKQAEQLTSAEVFRFDLDDAIGGNLQQAYFTGVTQYLADPSRLDQILASIEEARA